MKPLARDTHPDAAEAQIRIWRSWTPEERLASACNLLKFVRQRVEQAIRARYPHSSDDEVRIHVLRRAYGEEIAARVARYQGIALDA